MRLYGFRAAFSSRGGIMDWKEIDKAIQKIVSDIKDKCIIKNVAIRDNIFGILEDNCTVIYYPLENEKNRGFHIKRIVKNELEDFVYINTAKPIAEQIFAAAHEFGHIFEVSGKVWKMMGYSGFPTEEDEENITNRFAAELLMPAEVFKQSFLENMKEVGIKSGKVKVDNLVRVMVTEREESMIRIHFLMEIIFVALHTVSHEARIFIGNISSKYYRRMTCGILSSCALTNRPSRFRQC